MSSRQRPSINIPQGDTPRPGESSTRSPSQSPSSPPASPPSSTVSSSPSVSPSSSGPSARSSGPRSGLLVPLRRSGGSGGLGGSPGAQLSVLGISHSLQPRDCVLAELLDEHRAL